MTIRAVTDRIEALLSWVPDSFIRNQAEGAPLHLSSHVLDSKDGRMILFDGPRATVSLGPGKDIYVLPLAVPDQPGRYRLEIEAVAEGRFWASQRGYVPRVVDAERCRDGSLRFHCSSSGSRYDLNPARPGAFSIVGPFYGLGDSERCVEIPWSLSRYRGDARVLDVGYAHSEPRFVVARNALKIPHAIGLDPGGSSQSGILGVAGDARRPPFPSSTFDLIFAISVIEHIGRDNSVYFASRQPTQEFGDLEAASALACLLRQGGRLLVTVPFGRREDHGWFVQYDLPRIDALVQATGCEVTLAEYYAYAPDGWHGPVAPGRLGDTGYRTGSGAGAVACLELTRGNSGSMHPETLPSPVPWRARPLKP